MVTREELVRRLHDMAMDELVNEQPELAKPTKQAELTREGMELVTQFERTNKFVIEMMNVEQAAEQFEHWLEKRRVWAMMKGETTLQVSIIRNYGTIDIEYGVTRSIMTKEPKALRIAREILTSEVEKAHEHFASINLPKEKHTNSTPSNQTTEAASFITFSPTRLSVKMESGKKMYRLHGGDWSKYGVPIYDEVLISSGYDVENIPDVGLTLSGYSAQAQIVKGQPKRITRLDRI